MGFRENPLASGFPLDEDRDALKTDAAVVFDRTTEHGRVLRRCACHRIHELVRTDHALLWRSEIQTVDEPHQRDHDDEDGDRTGHWVQTFGLGEHHGVAAGKGQAGGDFCGQPILVVRLGRDGGLVLHASC